MKSVLRVFAALLVGLLFVSQVNATVRRVGPTDLYHQIGQAITAASTGDTILISPTSYQENLFINKRLTLIGSSFLMGAASTVYGYIDLQSGSSGTTIEGMRIEHGNNVINLGGGVSNITIRRTLVMQSIVNDWRYCIGRYAQPSGRIDVIDCLLIYTNHNNAGVIQLSGDSLFVRNTIFAGSVTSSAITGTASSIGVENCVFVNLARMFNLTGSFPMLVANNIVYDWSGAANWGTYPASSTLEYNQASSIVPPGTGNAVLSTNPFANYNATSNYQEGITDLHLVEGSPCIDAGQPALVDIIDGSPCDLGIYGGLQPFVDSGAPSYPFVTGLTVPGAITVGSPLPITGTGRIGRGY